MLAYGEGWGIWLKRLQRHLVEVSRFFIGICWKKKCQNRERFRAQTISYKTNAIRQASYHSMPCNFRIQCR
jgi:hypothetical protein